jgi:flavin-dependent dehydrogenase
MAETAGLDLHVDIYEPRDFSRPGPSACNMCGGIVSESLVQLLATEGINLPATVVQRGLDSYMLHTETGSVRIETPLHEKRIAAVHRGAGPRDLKERKWESFDGYLQKLAVEKGANLIRARVDGVSWADARPQLASQDGSPELYDLVVVAVGINSTSLKLFQASALDYQPPQTTKTFIREYYLGEEAVGRYLGSSMHVFLLDMPGLEFAALIPKGDYVTMCLLGDALDRKLFEAFINSPEVKRCMPPEWGADEFGCQCAPRINIRGAPQPFADRIVFIGDTGETRLYKDGIGAAYRTAKAAATTAVLEGISAGDFWRHYRPTCRTIGIDNVIGKVIFGVTNQIRKRRFSRRAVLRMVFREQQEEHRRPRMSLVLWDMFTGSAPYREILLRTLQPVFLASFLWHNVVSALASMRIVSEPMGD